MNNTLQAKTARFNLAEFIRKYKIELIMTALFSAVLVSMRVGFAATIWDAAQNAGQGLVDNIRQLYCFTLFPVLAVINIVLLAFTKDDKRIAVLKRTLIIICGVFIAIMLISVIRDTLLAFGNSIEGADVVGQ